jgi:hypothetical protein
MTTKRLVPRSNKDGGIGSQDKPWLNGYFKETHAVGSMFYPTTTSLARPNNAQTGQIFFDTTINGLIIWDGAKWIELTNPISFALNALTVTTDGEYGIGGQVGGGGIYSKGQQVTLTATADEHYSFVRWSGDLTELAQPLERITTVNMTDSFNIFAEFAVETYTLTLQAGPNGSIVSGSGSYPYSSYAEIEASPESGYDFSGWSSSVADSVVDPSSAKTQVFVDADMNITAEFALKPYEIFTNIFGSGTVDIQDTATYNSQVVISRTPSPGYDNNNQLTKIRDRSGNLINVFTKEDGRQFFNMPNSDVFVDVFFDAIQYTITDSSDDNVNISITKTSAIVDDKIYFSVNFNRGYEIDGNIALTTSDGTAITLTAEDDQDINFSFIMPAKNVFLSVSSSLVDYGITLTSEPSGSAVLNARFQNLSEYSLDPQGFTTEGSYNQKVFIDIQESEGLKLKYFSGQKDNGGLLSTFGLHRPGIHEYGLNIDYDFHKEYDPSVALAKDDLNNVFFYMPEDSVTINGVFEEHKYITRAENIPNSYSFSSTFGVDESSTTFTYEPYSNHKFFAFSCYGNTGSIDKNITLAININSSALSFSLSSEADLYNNRSITLEIPTGKTMAQLSEFLASDTVYDFSLDTSLSSSFVFNSGLYTLPGTLASNDFTDIDISATENRLGDEVSITLTPEDGYEIITGDLNITRMDNGQVVDFSLTSDVFTSNITFNTPSAGTLLGYSMTPSRYTLEIIESADSNDGLTEIVTDNLELIGEDLYATFGQNIQLTSAANDNFELIEYQSYYIDPKDTDETQNEFFIDISDLDLINFDMPAGNLYITPIYLGIESIIYYNYPASRLSLSGNHPTSGRYSETINISKSDLITTEGYQIQTLKIHKYESDLQAYPQNKGELIDTIDNVGLLADDDIISFVMPSYPIIIDITASAEPKANFVISPESTYYFGDTIELTNMSTAPSGDGIIESISFTTTPSLPLVDVDTAIRMYYKEHNYIELDGVGDTIFNFNKDFTILFNGAGIPQAQSFDTFSRGRFGLGGYSGANQLLHYSENLDGKSFRAAGTNMWTLPTWRDDTLETSWSGGVGFRFSQSSRTFALRTYDPLRTGGPGISQYGFTYNDLNRNYGAPEGFIEQSADISSYPFVIGAWTAGTSLNNNFFGGGSTGALYKDFLFIERNLTTSEVDEFINADSGSYDQLSFYDEVVDWVELGAQSYPSVAGKKGVISGSLVGSSIHESHFESIKSLTLPDGSVGETEGSIDITLTVIDDQGISREITKTINFTPKPLDGPEIISYTKTVKTENGLDILGAPAVLGVEYTTIDGDITTTTEYI